MYIALKFYLQSVNFLLPLKHSLYLYYLTKLKRHGNKPYNDFIAFSNWMSKIFLQINLFGNIFIYIVRHFFIIIHGDYLNLLSLEFNTLSATIYYKKCIYLLQKFVSILCITVCVCNIDFLNYQGNKIFSS